jgi:hypothetical protein
LGYSGVLLVCSWSALGVLLGCSWGALGALGVLLELARWPSTCKWSLLGPLEVLLEWSWGLFGCAWGALGVSCGFLTDPEGVKATLAREE